MDLIILLTVQVWCAALGVLEEVSRGKTCSGLCHPLWADRPGSNAVRNPGNRWSLFWELTMASKIRLSISQAWILATGAAVWRQTSVSSVETASSFRLWHPSPTFTPTRALESVLSCDQLHEDLGTWLLREAVRFSQPLPHPYAHWPIKSSQRLCFTPSPLCPPSQALKDSFSQSKSGLILTFLKRVIFF